MKRYSPAYVFGEMQIKIMSYHYTPTRMTNMWNMMTANVGKEVEQKDLSATAGGHAKCCVATLEEFSSFLEKSHDTTQKMASLVLTQRS